ncbi:MAG TPA: phosphopantothenoylcysteine decarboxylase [Candidatus Saccharimonadales bacterium]|nr:phosphopantothenoylcysteine decarboxylase [Candidatus Saccharimonadales bacterium]
MNCIVTAGPTYEPLDDVRRLTNFSTGRLGTELANFLTARGHQVALLFSSQATYSSERHAQRVEVFTTTADLQEKLQMLSSKNAGAVFHAAAVSDFRFGRIQLQSPHGKLTEIKSKKIPTSEGTLLAELLPTRKIIAELRSWFPAAKLVGWKYEAEGKQLDAIRAAEQQLTKYLTDATVANGPAYGEGFGLITRRGHTHLADPPTLYDALEKLMRD